MGWLRHAFAIDPPDPGGPTERQQAVVERLCNEVVRRGLATPALMFLEMSRPLNFLGAQALHFLAPIVALLREGDAHVQLASFLERRDSIEYLCRRIEELEAARE